MANPIDDQNNDASDVSFDKVVKEELGRDDGNQPIGLAFSGGGIRSATFNLGVIQGLAHGKMLDKFDYLSTVSGGGYIGAWLVSWAKRAGGISRVQAQLTQESDEHVEPAPVAWLRRYSNYLTPRKGLLSLDTLTGITYHVRNVFLSTLTIGLFAFGVASVFAAFVSGLASGGTREILSMLGLMGGGLAAMWMWYCLPLVSGERRLPNTPVHNIQIGHAHVIGIAVLTVLSVYCWSLAGGFLATTEVNPDFKFYRNEARIFASGYLLFSLAGIVASQFRAVLRAGHWDYAQFLRLLLPLLLTAPVFGLYGGLAPNMATADVAGINWDQSWLSAGIVAPITCLVISLIVSIHLGMAGRALASEAYFWISRVGGSMVRLALALCVLPAAFLFIPPFFDWLQATVYVGGFGAVYLVLARHLGSSAQTSKAGSEDTETGQWKKATSEMVVQAAPYVLTAVLLGLMVTVVRDVYFPKDQPFDMSSFSSRWHSCKEYTDLKNPSTAEVAKTGELQGQGETVLKCTPAYEAEFAANAFKLSVLDSDKALSCGLLALIVSLILSLKIDANLFSLHTYYRNRLTNAYLAASADRDHRNPDTGINPEDSLFLEELDHGRPYLLVNTTLNLCGEGNDLAWQDRKAMSFVFGRKYCGFDAMAVDGSAHTNYMPTSDFASGKGDAIKLNLPMTISGAAASPLAGYHTSSGVSIMLALLGARLGWWFPNPARVEVWEKGMRPARLLPTFFKEIFGVANSRRGLLYLSDGGHFENLGVYELIKRGCSVIVASDGSADPEFRFDDLANAIHKARVDFGIEIEIDPGPIRPVGKGEQGDAPVRYSASNFVTGTIRYKASRLARFQGLEDGKLIYVKASLPQRIEKEARDVWFYAAAHEKFPHEPTSDQWFDEEQFEAYRKLGSLIGADVAGVIGAHLRQQV